jgi:hypothetical protein
VQWPDEATSLHCQAVRSEAANYGRQTLASNAQAASDQLNQAANQLPDSC